MCQDMRELKYRYGQEGVSWNCLGTRMDGHIRLPGQAGMEMSSENLSKTSYQPPKEVKYVSSSDFANPDPTNAEDL